MKTGFMNISVAILVLLFFGNAFAEEWGKILSTRIVTNVRAERDASSPVKRKLEAGTTVKVDFLKNGWYAVFTPSEKERKESKALGYVFAKLLYDTGNARAGTISEKIIARVARDTKEYASVQVRNITCKLGQDGKETMSLELNRYYLPAMFSIAGESPRIVIDVTDTDSWNKEWSVIQVHGKLIRQIRTRLSKECKILRIVLDMEPRKTFFVNPVFVEDIHSYTLEIIEDKK
jgi:hypothetical protein